MKNVNEAVASFLSFHLFGEVTILSEFLGLSKRYQGQRTFTLRAH
jgi:hypothetical protein